MLIIIILFVLYMSVCYTINTINKGSTPRYHVSCNDWNNYLNRLGNLRRDCKDRLDINKETLHRGAAGYCDIWYVSHGSDYLFQLIDRHDYPEFAIITKQYNWTRKQFHKTCEERGINHMKGEYLDKPHI